MKRTDIINKLCFESFYRTWDIL